MAAPVRTNQANPVIRHPRTTFGAVVVNVNKRSVKLSTVQGVDLLNSKRAVEG